MDNLTNAQQKPRSSAPKKKLPCPETRSQAQQAIDKALLEDPSYFEGHDFTSWPLDSVQFPRGTNLSGAIFRATSLEYVTFSGCKLDGAQFLQAKGKGARFDDASLWGATFFRCDFTAANFAEAEMSEIRTVRTCFNKSSFADTILARAKVKKSSFIGVDLGTTTIADAVFQDNDLRGARFDPRDRAGVLMPDNFSRTAGANFAGNWYNDRVRLPYCNAVRGDAYRHRLASWLFSTSATTAVGYFLDKGYQFIESAASTEAIRHSIPEPAIAAGALFMFGAFAVLEDRLHNDIVRKVMGASGAARIGLQAARDYFSSRTNMVAMAGSPEAGRVFRHALMSVRRSWVPDPFGGDAAIKFKPTYRAFLLPSLNIIVCDRDHAEKAINVLQHRLAPTIGETIIAMPAGHDVGTKAPAAIGLTADHKLIATYNIGKCLDGEERNIVCFFDENGDLRRLEKYPAGDWDIPDGVNSAVNDGASQVIAAFIEVATQISTSKQPRLSHRTSERTLDID